MLSCVQHRSFELDALREEVRAIEGFSRGGDQILPFEVDAIDRKLIRGGLVRGALHDVTGESSSLGDDAAATLFAAGIAARAAAEGALVLWASRRRDLFAPALAQVGLTPVRLIQAECRCDEEVLAVMEEGLRHGKLATVIGEIGNIAMASTRRLQLVAEDSGTMALMIKKWRKPKVDPLTQASAALTRWKVGCLPSAAMPVPGIGTPRWAVKLIRQRGGEPCEWIMEGCDAEGRLALPAGPSHRSATPDRDAARHAA